MAVCLGVAELREREPPRWAALRRPTVEDLFALAAVYRVSPTELLQSSEEEFQQAVSDFTQAEATEALDEASTAIEQAARAVAQARKGVSGG